MLFLKQKLGRGVDVGLKHLRPGARDSLTSAPHMIVKRHAQCGFLVSRNGCGNSRGICVPVLSLHRNTALHCKTRATACGV